MRRDFQDHTHVLIREALIQTAHVRAQTFIDEWNLGTHEKPADFVIGDIDLGFGQHRGIRRLAQKLNQKIEADRAREHAGGQRFGKRFRHQWSISVHIAVVAADDD